MTSNSNLKKAVRAYAKENNLNYTTALRHLESNNTSRATVISVCSARGGTGKTTLAVALAEKAAQQQKRVLLIDADIQKGDIRQRLAAQGKGVASAADALKDAPETFQLAKHTYTTPTGVDVLLAPDAPEEAFPVRYSGKFFTHIVDHAAKTWDLIIVDTPTAEYYHDLFLGFALPQSNNIIHLATDNDPVADKWQQAICEATEEMPAKFSHAHIVRIEPNSWNEDTAGVLEDLFAKLVK